ncbi:MAG: lysylphosphatidylglycerol synthase domain-containing protein [Pseudomonadota bacterium]
MSTKKLIGRAWLLISVIVALYFVFSYLRDSQVDATRLLDAEPRKLCAAILAYAAYFLAISLTWSSVLHSVSARKIDLLESASQIALINLGKYIPGKIWGLAARGARLSELEYKASSIGRASFLEQALLLLTGLWLALVATAVVYGGLLPIGLLVITTAAILCARNTSYLVDRATQLFPRAEKALQFASINISYRKTFFLVIGFTLTWLFLIATFALLCASLTDISFDSRTSAVFVLSITAGYLAGFLAIFAPGGVGVREAAGAVALSEILPLELALFLMLIFRVWVVAAELLTGALILGTRVFRTSDK